MPVRAIVTDAPAADNSKAIELIEGIVADRGYDTDTIVEAAEKVGMEAAIPPKRNRRYQRDYDKYLYRLRYFAENAFFGFEALARYSYALCKKRCFVSCRCPYLLHCHLVKNLLTTVYS
jgi:IS5 family transposase